MPAALLAQRMHAPTPVAISGHGSTGGILEDLPRAVGAGRTSHRAPADPRPYRVVSNLAVLGCHPHPNACCSPPCPASPVQQVIGNTGFDLLRTEAIHENLPPATEEPCSLRQEVERDRLHIRP